MQAGRGRGRLDGDRWVGPILIAVLVAAAALLYWEGRGTTFFNGDDLTQITALSWSPERLLEPLNGHLILVSRLIFHVVATAFGPDYAVLRALGIAGVIAVDLLVFIWVRRRLGATMALAATVVVAFFGSAWEAIMWPGAQFTIVYSTAAGLAALLVLEGRGRGRRRDMLACGLLFGSLLAFSLGVCFAAGAAASILLRDDRRRRIWIFAVPLALWVVWWAWSLHFGSGTASLSNLPRIPIYAGESLAAVAAALTGVVATAGAGAIGFDTPPGRNHVVPILAAIAIAAAFVWLIRRESVRRFLRPASLPPTLWPPLVVLLCFWVLSCLSLAPGRAPQASRYMLPDLVLLLLIAAEAVHGITLTRTARRAIYAAAVVIVALNVGVIQQAREFFSDYSTNARAQLAMLELAGAHAPPDFVPAFATPTASGRFLGVSAAGYLQAVARYGSFADTPAEVEAANEPVRERADQELAAVLGIQLRLVGAAAQRRGCRNVTAPRPVAPAPGRTLLRARSASVLVLRRFAARPTAPAGLLGPGKWEELSVPRDRLRRRWEATAPSAGALTVCREPGGG